MSSEVETGAASPSDRIEALKVLSQAGVKTWASIEPVIDPEESLAIINASLPYVDAYKVGKLNHKENSTDWKSFGVRAVEMIRGAGKPLYVKVDLRSFFPVNFLREEEIRADVLNLPSRK